MPLRRCSINNCPNPADRSIGSCMLCAKHFCGDHFRADSHTCPSSENEPDAYYSAYDAAKKRYLEALVAKINVEALRSAATSARGGNFPCQIPAFDTHFDDPADRITLIASQCGGQNCHLDIEFNDSVTWIARIRLNDPMLPPPSIQARIFESEIAALEFLAGTKVPAPQVYGYALESTENPVGTSYVLMEKMAGEPLDWNDATPEQRKKIMEQLADVYLELEAHPFQLTGSLSSKLPGTTAGSSVNQTEVGSFAQVQCFETPERGLGPFKTLETAYTAIIRQQMQALATHEISTLPLDNYLTFLWRLKVLPDLIADSASREGPFYLKHFDDKGDHILVDEDYNITAIIDWEFASTESKELAFSSPCMMWPVGEFYDGDNDLAEAEIQFAAIFDARGREDIGDLVRQGRRWQRFLFFLGGGIPGDMIQALMQYEQELARRSSSK
ncbi:hypothetical protein F4806DRAFT_507807 [Annulohypoxylon nitens]|nr:hypothetical protein F4806DRAFT_507807 [Annulohypoxylon nitens]